MKPSEIVDAMTALGFTCSNTGRWSPVAIKATMDGHALSIVASRHHYCTIDAFGEAENVEAAFMYGREFIRPDGVEMFGDDVLGSLSMGELINFAMACIAHIARSGS